MFNQQQIKYLTAKDESDLLKNLENVKHRFINLLMLDGSMRVSEAISLQVKDFNFQKKEIYVKTLKRKKEVWRVVPMTDKILTTATEYWKDANIKKPDAFMFPSPNDSTKHISRAAIWKYLQKVSDERIHPHLLRHTYGSKLAETGASMLEIRDLLGHATTNTTEIYTHAASNRMRAAVNRIEEKPNFFARWRKRLVPTEPLSILPVNEGEIKFIVGREREMMELLDLTEKRVNVFLVGVQGIGKTHVLDNFNPRDTKVFRIHDTDKFKKTIEGLIESILMEYPERADMYAVDVETLTTKSIKELCAQLCAVSLKHEYTLIFDDVTRITPTAVNALEKLRNHFHIIAAARELPLRLGTWLTNFQKIELKPLSRAEAVELIIRASEDYRDKIEDFEAYKNHVWNTTNGIPQFITETVNRFRKEGFISAQRVTSFRHTAALKEVDFTPFLLVFIGGIVVIKYLGKEAQEEDKGAFMLFGSIATVVLLFGRFFYNKAKRKFV